MHIQLPTSVLGLKNFYSLRVDETGLLNELQDTKPEVYEQYLLGNWKVLFTHEFLSDVSGTNANAADLSPRRSCQPLSGEEFRDKVLGIVFGVAIGDAVGLATEFQSPIQAAVCYGSGEPSLVSPTWAKNIFRDKHRIHWEEGDWTDDTDQMILIMKAFCDCNDNTGLFLTTFSHYLLSWAHRGYPDLGDAGGAGIGQTLTKTLLHPEFLQNPHAAARNIYADSEGRAAANGGVMRTAVTGIPYYYDLEKTADFTIQVCKVTHADPRCYSSAVAISIAIAMILQGYSDVEFIRNSAFVYTMNYAPESSHTELKKYILAENAKELDLAERNSIGYTFKAMGCGFVALRYKSFSDAIIRITMEAGDADTNGAVAGGVMGAFTGYSKLPANWLSALVHHDWLLAETERFLQAVSSP